MELPISEGLNTIHVSDSCQALSINRKESIAPDAVIKNVEGGYDNPAMTGKY